MTPCVWRGLGPQEKGGRQELLEQGCRDAVPTGPPALSQLVSAPWGWSLSQPERQAGPSARRALSSFPLARRDTCLQQRPQLRPGHPSPAPESLGPLGCPCDGSTGSIRSFSCAWAPSSFFSKISPCLAETWTQSVEGQLLPARCRPDPTCLPPRSPSQSPANSSLCPVLYSCSSAPSELNHSPSAPGFPGTCPHQTQC